MPWQIGRLSPGQSQVYGFALGGTTPGSLADLPRPQVFPDLAVDCSKTQGEQPVMMFRVKHKGIEKYLGRLELAYAYLAAHWGSASQAYELGVKLEPVR